MSWTRTLKIVVTCVIVGASAASFGGCEALIGDTLPQFTCSGSSANACPANEICAPSLGQCVARSGACGVIGCSAGMSCDPGTQSCVSSSGDSGLDDVYVPPDTYVPDTSVPQDVFVPPDTGPDGSVCNGPGCGCAHGTDCLSGLCADPAILDNLVSGRVCTSPCCTSSDCGAGNVCFAAGTGGNYCVPSTVLGRSTLGTIGSGASCSSSASCRSGLCGKGGACLDACCSDANCGSGTQCAYNTETGHDVLQCVANPGGTGGQDSSCNSNSDCHGGMCVQVSANPFVGPQCIIPCCGSTTCGSSNVCDDVQITKGSSDWIPACVPPASGPGNGTGVMGSNCSQNGDGDCRSGHCLGTKCTDDCCTDADCTAVAGWRCVPTLEQGATVLRCGLPQ